ncbi:T9SS type A sorting domain-containing protein [candidate division KSB1 bacterium]|nr:T9SS type A sorting domain-containing protein [candidate division KSB1 bacterium]
MKMKTGKLKNRCAIALGTVVVLTFNTCIIPQEVTHSTIHFIFRPENNWTQFAIWLENKDGEYIQTAYISDFIGRRGGGNRTGDVDIDSPSGNRLTALPVWSHARGIIDMTFGIENYYPPAQNQSGYPEEMDAVSGATPGARMQTKTLQLSGLPGEYGCWIEVNRSYDFNPYHNYSFYRGQPSLVWSTTILVSNSADSSMVSDYRGYGSADGSDGEIHVPDSTITTATNLLRDMGGYKFKVVYSPSSASVADLAGSSSASSFSLKQNVPNPFNSTTEISYYLPHSSHVNLAIYTINGRRMITLVDKHETAGDKGICWDGRDAKGQVAPNGIYLYKLQTDDYVNIKSMAFLK